MFDWLKRKKEDEEEEPAEKSERKMASVVELGDITQEIFGDNDQTR